MLDLTLFLTICISLFTDLTRRRIYNLVTIPAMVLGVGLNTWQNGMAGFIQSLVGWAIGLFILFIPFMLGGVSGGDIKLLAAIGALKGVDFILQSVLLTALAGGFYILIYIVVTKQFLVTIKNLINTLYLMLMAVAAKKLSYMPRRTKGQALTVPALPYAGAIFTGVLLTFILR